MLDTLSVRQKTVKSAVALADSLEGSKIVVFTKRGYMADHVSHLRPAHSPIFAFTPNEATARRLILDWDVLPLVMNFDINPDHTIADAEQLLLRRGLIQPGDQLIVLTDVSAGEERFDSIQLRRVV